MFIWNEKYENNKKKTQIANHYTRRDEFYQTLKHNIYQQQLQLKKNIIEVGMDKKTIVSRKHPDIMWQFNK